MNKYKPTKQERKTIKHGARDYTDYCMDEQLGMLWDKSYADLREAGYTADKSNKILYDICKRFLDAQ